MFKQSEVKVKEQKTKDEFFKKFDVVISADSIDKKIEKELENIRSQVELQGFRKGHAPIEKVRSRYQENAFGRALSNAINEISNQIVSENKFKLLKQADVKFEKEPKLGEKAEFSISYTLWPKVAELNFSEIKITQPKIELSDEEKENELKILQNNFAKDKLVEDKEYEVKHGDSVDIFFEGKKDGVPFEGGRADNYRLAIGSNTFILGFEEQIIGHKKGDEFIINVSFPEEYFQKNLAGQPVTFDIKINAIYTRELPELTDEYAKELKFESLDKLKEILYSNLVRNCESQFFTKAREPIFDKLVSIANVKIPESFKNEEIKNALDRMEADFKEKQKKATESSEVIEYKEFDRAEEEKKLAPEIEKNLKRFFVINKIMTNEKIDISDDEIRQFIIQDAMHARMDPKQLLESIEKDENLKRNVAYTIKENKVFDFILSKITKEDKKMSANEFSLFIRDYKI